MTVTFTPSQPIWCAGCGHFAAQAALVRALAELKVPAHETLVLAGIGCSGTVQNNMRAYGYHSMHGRVVPTAIGAAAANPALTVIAVSGDGDAYAIGIGHLVHAMKCNPPVLYIVLNNGIYGLTKGQESPASDPSPLDPIALGLSSLGTTFLARGYSGAADQLLHLTKQALEHVIAKRGLAFLEVLSPCITYNDIYPELRARIQNIEDGCSYPVEDRARAFETVLQLKALNKIPCGLLFRSKHACLDADAARVDPSPATLVDHQPGRHMDALREMMKNYMI